MQLGKYILISSICLILSGCDDSGKIESTPVSVKEIIEIGELISAQYYGETISSLKKIHYIQDTSELRKRYLELQDIYAKISEKYRFNERKVEVFEERGYTAYPGFNVIKKASGIISLKKFLKTELSQKDWKNFYAEYKARINELLLKKDKTEVVYIGRGWVKAGVNLNDINLNTGWIRRHDTLWIKNLDPLILDADINPWLIPGKLKGYEIIKIDKSRDISFDDIVKVKVDCREKLKTEALQSGIYEYAISSAEETLEGLLGLASQSEGNKINVVKILPTKYFDYKVEYLMNGRIDKSELEELGQLVGRDTTYYDAVQFNTRGEQLYFLVKFLDELYYETSNTINDEGWLPYYNNLKLFEVNARKLRLLSDI